MTVRLESADDMELGALIALDRECFGDEAWNAWTWRESIMSGHRRIRSERDAAGLAGYAVIAILGDVAELERIAVRADVRRAGIGRRLLAGAIEESRVNGADALVLEVRDDNAAARAFYRRYDFYEISRRRGYYGRGSVDAVLLQLTWGTA